MRGSWVGTYLERILNNAGSIIGLLSALGVLIGFLRYRAQNRESDANAAKGHAVAGQVTTEAAVAVVKIHDDVNERVFQRMERLLAIRDEEREIVEKRVSFLEREAESQWGIIKSQGKRIDELETAETKLKKALEVRDGIIEEMLVGILILLRQIRKAKLEPEWKPPDEPPFVSVRPTVRPD